MGQFTRGFTGRRPANRDPRLPPGQYDTGKSWPVLTAEVDRMIKAADHGAAYYEATRLAGFDPAEARRFFGKPPALSPALERDYLTPWPASVAQERFRERLIKLTRE